MDEHSRKKAGQEKRNAFYVLLIVILVALLSAMIVILKLRKLYGDNVCISADCVTSSEFFLDIINNSINPCDNFYEFACGGYDGPASTIEEAQGRVTEEFMSFITGSINEYDSPAVKKQKKYYKTCMNTSAIEEDDNRSLKKIYEILGGWPVMTPEWVNVYNLEKITEKCNDLGLYYDWFINVEADVSFDNENRTLRISKPTNANFVDNNFSRNYQLLIENIVKRLRTNNSLDYISAAAKSIVEFENSLSQIISESDGGYVETTIEELKIGFPVLPWDALTKSVIIEENTTIIEAEVLYFPKLVRFLEKASPRTKSNYIMWKITQSMYQFLPRDIRREFEAYDLVTKNKMPLSRENFCYQVTQTVFAYVSEAAYAKRYSSDRGTIKEIFKNIKTIMREHINVSNWMNDTHKAYAMKKLKKVKIFIGGPDEVFNETKFEQILGVDEIDILNLNNTLDVVRSVDKSRDKYNLNLRRKQISYARARLYQGIVNIQATKYLPMANLIYLPAAVIGGVFDSHKGLNFRNYSVLGTIIAHELSHAFGILDNLIQLNGKEAMRWSNSSFQSFLNQSECLLEQCQEFNEENFINDTRCQKTFDENFADYTSVNVAYEAFQRIKLEEINQLPGINYTLSQLFWISYAATMCDGVTNNSANITATYKRHLQPSQRILGSYRNSEHFGKDFNCTVGSYMNPVDKCIVL